MGEGEVVAYLESFVCEDCYEEKREINPSDRNYICNECDEIREKNKRKQHFKKLDKLSTEKKIEKNRKMDI